MLSRTLRAASVLLLAATCALTGTDAAVAARPEAAPAPASARSSVAAEADTLDLRGDGVLPQRNGRVARVQLWKVRTLYYYETLPAKWDWSLSTAVAKWNGSGARIRMVRTTIPRKAQVRIGYAKIGNAAGLATVGATRNAFVHLSSRFSTMDALDARNRVAIMNVLAHELGHVLGFQHTSARCSLMAPVLDVDACGTVPTSQPGYYRCRTIDTALVKRFVRAYGGTARYPAPTWCLIDPLPPVLGGVSFSGGYEQGAPVGIHWQKPASAPSGSKIVIRRWLAGSCSTVPAGAATITPSMATTSWQDPVAFSPDDACFRIQLVNRYGAGRTPATQALTRWAGGPAAPVIGTATWDAQATRFHAPAAHAAGTHLTYRLSDDPTVCPSNPSGAEAVQSEHDGVVDFLTTHPEQCVSFFAVDDETLAASAPTSVTVEAPLPTETLDPTIRLEPWGYPWWYAHVTGLAAGNHVGYEVFPGSCPSTVPTVSEWRTQTLGGSNPHEPVQSRDDVLFPGQAAGTNCVVFTALDWWGYTSANTWNQTTSNVDRHGPVTMREFVDEGPPSPVLGEPDWEADSGVFAIPVDHPASIEAIYDASNPGTCLAPGSTDATHVSTGWRDSPTRVLVVTPPTPDTCVTFYRSANDGVTRVGLGVERRLVVTQG